MTYWFVSYAFEGRNGTNGFGNVYVEVKGTFDIRTIEKQLHNENRNRVVLQNFIKINKKTYDKRYNKDN